MNILTSVMLVEVIAKTENEKLAFALAPTATNYTALDSNSAVFVSFSAAPSFAGFRGLAI